MRFPQPSPAPGKLSGKQGPHWFGLCGSACSVGDGVYRWSSERLARPMDWPENGRSLSLFMPQAAESPLHFALCFAAVRLMLLTGFRISEVQGLQRDWLHPDQGYVHFSGYQERRSGAGDRTVSRSSRGRATGP
jgi:hypothetical protein